MKKALQPQRVPQPDNTVVAVQSLQPEFTLYNTTTGERKRVYGGNPWENSVYVAGQMPKIFRMAAEEGNHEQELIFEPLPATIEEISLNESPECKLLITDFTMVALPEEKPKPGCKIITHPATPAAKNIAEQKYHEKHTKKLQRKAQKNTDPKQLYFFIEPEFQPKNATA